MIFAVSYLISDLLCQAIQSSGGISFFRFSFLVLYCFPLLFCLQETLFNFWNWNHLDLSFRELLKGPLYYASTITFACAYYWKTSPIAIATICNLCAGDGFADIIGRRFGRHKLPYNSNKSFAGSIAMASAGFLASLGFMSYFSSFGYIQGSWEMVSGFLMVSLASALVESHPLSSELDDNLTVPLTSMLVGSLVF